MVHRTHGEPGTSRSHDATSGQHRQAMVHRTVSSRQEIKRRRTNIVFFLLMLTVGSLFLAATTHANAMMYTFALSFLSLCGYCYKLVQVRQLEQQNSAYSENQWFRAA
ncbi:MAG: hypothetical protein JWN62_2729 [Acidimicrobiales bacterium]|nr:hypothetical protein [Acidimicrobiales bacterium]